MSIMNMITKNFNFKNNKKNDLNKFYESFSQISHELINNFIAIRASIGNIKQSINKSDEVNRINNIEKTIAGIDKKLNHSTTLINMMVTVASPVCNWPTDITNNSIKDCIQQTIQSYPFSSEKYASFINITNLEKDFLVIGNLHLIKSVFYCLIYNMVRSLYNCGNGEATIELEKNRVHFKFIDIKITDPTEQNLFSLGRPENPGNGLAFITNVLKSMNGNVNFKQESNGAIAITLLFST